MPGPIPVELAQLPKLKKAILGRNQLTGWPPGFPLLVDPYGQNKLSEFVPKYFCRDLLAGRIPMELKHMLLRSTFRETSKPEDNTVLELNDNAFAGRCRVD